MLSVPRNGERIGTTNVPIKRLPVRAGILVAARYILFACCPCVAPRRTGSVRSARVEGRRCDFMMTRGIRCCISFSFLFQCI